MASAPLTYFVSYSRADEAFALKLAERLRAEGVNLWIDQLDIPAGDRWDKAVQAALKSSQGLMVLLSKTSVDSDNVMDEVSYALDESKQVIPVLCGKCEIPFRLRRLQYVDLSADFEAGFPLLLKNLGVKGSPARDPAIAPEKASTASRASGGPGRIPDRGLAEKRRRSLAFVGLGAVAVALAIASLRGCVPPQPPPPQVLQREDVQAALSTAEDIEVEALELTVQANAQPWDSVKSDRQWRRIEELWENAAAPLKVMLDNNRDYLPLRLRVQNRHLEYTNRQVFTSAMYDYRKAFS
ncbi:MAG: toll/interleukin-1 receptor domain-containing protein [Phormidesmis sp. RL_2_1]|nr:toll/interleukin-1 receptor domain-containing protein [Phormidesmis sp. RL_2_1]